MTLSPPTMFARALRAFFTEHLPRARGLSAHTVRSYRDAFVLLLRFLGVRHACEVVALDLTHLGPDDLLAFLDHLEAKRGNGPGTRNARLAAVHAFARFVATRDPAQVDTAQRLLAVPIKRARIQPVEYLEADEIRAMLDAIDQRRLEGRRDYSLLLTLFNTGARVQELLDISPRDLQLERPHLVRLSRQGPQGARRAAVAPDRRCAPGAAHDGPGESR